MTSEPSVHAPANTVLPIDARAGKVIQNLLEKSHVDYIDLNTSLDWSAGIDRGVFPKRQDHCWLFGTRFWEALTESQRREVAWQEMGRDISMFIWLEQTLPPLYVGYVVKQGESLHPDVREYLMVFSKEEIVHTLMFRRYMHLACLETFAPPEGLNDLFGAQLPTMDPLVGILCTYLLELV